MFTGGTICILTTARSWVWESMFRSLPGNAPRTPGLTAHEFWAMRLAAQACWPGPQRGLACGKSGGLWSPMCGEPRCAQEPWIDTLCPFPVTELRAASSSLWKAWLSFTCPVSEAGSFLAVLFAMLMGYTFSIMGRVCAVTGRRHVGILSESRSSSKNR